MSLLVQSPRARAVDIRTYCRPLDDEGSAFETREQMLRRSMFEHHKRLLRDAGKKNHREELGELLQLGREGKAAVAGRTQWLGGTPYAYERAACQYNCSYLKISTVFDLVDHAWLLLNGCGVGFKPQVGVLHGYTRPIYDLEVIPSTQSKEYKGRQENVETLPCEDNDYTWTISVGDSAAAWAKGGGKLFTPRLAKKLCLDFSEVRGPGGRLRGYGWICNGYRPLAQAFVAMHNILNASAGQLLDDVQIIDVANWWGTVLSSRRAAEIALMDMHNPRIHEFMKLKHEYWKENPQRRQSNNTILAWAKPTCKQLEEVLRAADECGGCPAICNASAAMQKAPHFSGLNPCAEILLHDKGFCNLVTNCLPRFRRNFSELERSVYLMARANYRQTCVDLHDGVLQPAWHQTNESLRLCGVSITGIVQADWLTDYQIRRMRNAAVTGAYSMADELRLPRPKAVTAGKPEGSQSKTLGSLDIGEIAEGIHRPLGRWIFNWVNFSRHDPLVGLLESAGYRTLPNPSDESNVLVCFPVEYSNIRFDRIDGGREVNLEGATAQLNRYLRWNTLWADHNMSMTCSYSPHEIPEIVEWLDRNWDNGFIAVSFLRRTDPTKTARDLGHPYLPQEVVEEGPFREYQSSLREVQWDRVHGIYDIDGNTECAGGACPIK